MAARLTNAVLSAFLVLCALPALAQNPDPALRAEQPPAPTTVADVIRLFAQKEAQFARAREQYTFRQSVKVQTLEGDTVDGEYQLVTDIDYDSRGRRVENVAFAPQPTLTRIFMGKEDFDDLRNILPFVLTSETLTDYNITYLGKQKQDELDTYVFDLEPKVIEKGRRYFQGRIWVDDHDLQIVKTYGKSVPDIRDKKGDNENLFPRFTTWREQVDGIFWFPTYTRADDVLHFRGGKRSMPQDVRIRIIVKYTNYKRFGSSVRITYDGREVIKDPATGEKQTSPAPQPTPPPAQTPLPKKP